MKFFRRGNDAHQDDTDSKVEVQGIPSESAPPDGKRDGSISTAFRFFQMQNTLMVTSLIVFLGLATCGGFLGMGIVTAQQVQDEQFARSAIDLIKKMQNAWNDYVNAAAMIHGRCRGRNFTREDFRELYEYLTAGLDFQAAQFDPNITYAERAEAEAEASAFYAEYYPYYDYQGFIGFETDNSTELTSRSVQDYYFPIHYMEPVEGNERAIGLDYYASGSRRLTVEFCMEEGLPGLTDRLRLVQETEEVSYGVVLMHPGYNLTTNNDVWPHDLASIVIRIPDLLLRSAENQGEESAVYLYDKSDSSGETIFLGAAQILPRPNFESAQLIPIEEIEFDVMKSQNTDFIESDVEAANKIWTVVVVRQPGTFQPDILFVIIGAVLIFLAAMGLATWVYLHMKRIARYNRERVEVEAEKAGLILATAEEAARVERELNDFIAHE
jgi:CHASE1-domain containing sensor protein